MDAGQHHQREGQRGDRAAIAQGLNVGGDQAGRHVLFLDPVQGHPGQRDHLVPRPGGIEGADLLDPGTDHGAGDLVVPADRLRRGGEDRRDQVGPGGRQVARPAGDAGYLVGRARAHQRDRGLGQEPRCPPRVALGQPLGLGLEQRSRLAGTTGLRGRGADQELGVGSGRRHVGGGRPAARARALSGRPTVSARCPAASVRARARSGSGVSAAARRSASRAVPGAPRPAAS